MTKKGTRLLLCLMSLLMAPASLMWGQSVTLEECREAVRANYPIVARLDLISQTRDASLENIARGWLPQITALAQGTLQSDVTKLPDEFSNLLSAYGVAPRGISRGQYRVAAEVSQTIYDGGRIRAASDMARLQADVDEAATEVELYEAEERMEQLFFGVLLLDERLRLCATRSAVLADNLRKVERLYEGGVAAAYDVAALRAEVIQCRQDSLSLVADRDALKRMLALFCGFNEIPQSLVTPQISDFRVGKNRPELQAIDARLNLLDAQQRRLNANLLPTLSAFAQGWYGYTGYDMFHDMMQRTPTLNGIVGLRLTWNISSLYTRRSDLATLRLKRERAENDRQLFLLGQSISRTEHQASVDKYTRLLADDDEIVGLRRQVRQAAEARLDGGVIDVNGLIQELTREKQAEETRALHFVQMLQEACALQHVGK